MTSEIRANTLKNRVGLGTVSFTNTGIVVSGIVTANSFSGTGDLDIDGHTELDNTNIVGLVTVTNVSSGIGLKLIDSSSKQFFAGGGGGGTPFVGSFTGHDFRIQVGGLQNAIFKYAAGATGNLELGPSSGIGITFNGSTGNAGYAGIVTTSGMLNANGDITITSPSPTINFTENNGDPDYRIFLNGGIFNIDDVTNNVQKFSINTTRITLNGTTLVNDNTLYIGDKLVHWTDDDTMIRFPSNDTISFETAGSEKLRINSSGHLSLGGSNVTDVNMITINGTGQTQNIGIVFNKTNSPARAHGINVHNGSGDLIFFDYTANAERLRIATTGKISIGTQNVTEGILQVNGDVTAGYHHGGGIYGMLAKRKFDGTSALGGYAIRYASGYESPWIVGYNAGTGYNNQITFGSMTTSDRSLETGVQKRMVIDMASGFVGISSASPVEKFDVSGSINAGGENAPVFKIHNEQGNRVHAFKHYFDVSKGASSGSANNRTLVAITMNESFHQAFFEVTYGTRLQAVSDSHTRPNKVIFGVNRFNSASSVNVTKTVIEQHSDASSHCDVNIVSISATVYHIRLEFSTQPNVSSGAGGWVEGCNVLGATFHDVNVYYGIRN